MFALSTVQTSIFDIAHFLWVTTAKHLLHDTIIVGRIVAWIDVCKPVPVIAKDLFKDVPVLRGYAASERTELGCWDMCGAAFVPHLTRSLHPRISLRRGTLTHLSHL